MPPIFTKDTLLDHNSYLCNEERYTCVNVICEKVSKAQVKATYIIFCMRVPDMSRHRKLYY